MEKPLTSWGRYPVVECNQESFVFTEQLEKLADRSEDFIPRGNGRSYGDSALGKRALTTLKFDKILSFDTAKGVFECQPGITLSDVLQVIVPQGWFLRVTPGTKLITVGGAVGSNVHGKNHRTEGSFSRHIIDMDVRLASNEEITCSPTQNTDLFEATCGGMGLTGMVTRVKFRLKKIETSYIRQKQIKAQNLDELLSLFDKYQHYSYTVAWIDCLTKGKNSGRGILTVGEHAAFSELIEEQKKEPLKLPSNKKLNFPFTLPAWVLNTFTVKAFNFLYYLKNYKKEMDSVVLYDPVFYTLDAINNWNRMYGKAGFVQYQFVMPLESRQGLVEILNRIGEKGMGSFLTVLKVLGKQESMISFCREGYTLALDFPLRKGVLEFLDELDEIVLKYGGRIYITKDARMKPDMLKNYPELDKFKDIVKKYNPDGKIRSAQSDRLLLTEPK
ncbi:FAD-binding oxidoreductase [Mucilaginibacter sp. L3T2-6]|uniref:FAD-binding oxidoreductase n=1 Tax=Mucilaginibacter sp. L3T2-6 TaxID=3062491 RepID=UPI00267699AC|nr:FAD-binding oxidoreductase [Mucilaginibacter sp. L3T2-6]MDO3642862.1 FAD-binding oxidoreductase [Mucilaginibacter sp. L3T2-6]MDV6215187.1 FAD-binding oxidoreductase [Mucilaginibacter sp. L3T2-6]